MDLLADEGLVMLGSRLKRLAERLQANAAMVAAHDGVAAQPSELAILLALFRNGPAPISRIAEQIGIRQPSVTRILGNLLSRDLVARSAPRSDNRERWFELSAAGRRLMDDAMTTLWPRIAAALEEVCDGPALLEQLDRIEAGLAEAPLVQRPGGGLRIRRFSDELAEPFYRLNAAWITSMFELEPTDEEVLRRPREALIEPGGDILFVEAPCLGIVGTCALRRTGPAEFELTKMCVADEAQGRGAGKFLLDAAIRRAAALGAARLYLLTNARCAPAIHLYEKAGFVHDAAIMDRFGRTYARCDVAMNYVGPALGRDGPTEDAAGG
jgi:DNA-binding MarR family transcriptional regulator/N-acetylglutamate synthase-like GNAT family acetyltransferase